MFGFAMYAIPMALAVLAGHSEGRFLPGPGLPGDGPWNPSPWNQLYWDPSPWNEHPWNPSPWPQPQPGGYAGIACPMIYAPECGWDGQTYPNACVRNCNGVPKLYDGPCYGGGPMLGYPPLIPL